MTREEKHYHQQLSVWTETVKRMNRDVEALRMQYNQREFNRQQQEQLQGTASKASSLAVTNASNPSPMKSSIFSPPGARRLPQPIPQTVQATNSSGFMSPVKSSYQGGSSSPVPSTPSWPTNNSRSATFGATSSNGFLAPAAIINPDLNQNGNSRSIFRSPEPTRHTTAALGGEQGLQSPSASTALSSRNNVAPPATPTIHLSKEEAALCEELLGSLGDMLQQKKTEVLRLEKDLRRLQESASLAERNDVHEQR